MMVAIRKQLVTGRARRVNSGTNSRRYITVHETANPARGANAAAHGRLLAGGYDGASWHYTVDDREVVQHYDHGARCWHAGTTAGNNTSIGVEICVNADGDYPSAVRRAAELVAHIMRAENIPLSRVVQHNRWTGKNCPTRLRRGDAGGWAGFLARVQNPTPAPQPAPKPAPKPILEDDMMPFIISAPGRGQALISGDWKPLKSPDHVRAVMRLTPGWKNTQVVEMTTAEFDLMHDAFRASTPSALGSIQQSLARLLDRPAAEVDAQAVADAIPAGIASDVVDALVERLK